MLTSVNDNTIYKRFDVNIFFFLYLLRVFYLNYLKSNVCIVVIDILLYLFYSIEGLEEIVLSFIQQSPRLGCGGQKEFRRVCE